MTYSVPTPLLQFTRNLFLKLEFLHPGRSHKARAAEGILNRAEASGELVRHSGATIIEKTGGNLGIALAIEGIRRGYNVELVVGLSFSPRKRRLLRQLGAQLIGITELRKGVSPKDVISTRLSDPTFRRRRYVNLDQFSDPGSLQGHMDTLAPEIYKQLIDYGVSPNNVIHLIKGAGTGASAAAIYTYLTAMGLNVFLHLVQPQGCNYNEGVFIEHPIQGVAVGRAPPFLDLSTVSSFIDISPAEAEKGHRALLRNFGLFVGISSGANFIAIHKFLSTTNLSLEGLVVSVLYDRGEDY